MLKVKESVRGRKKKTAEAIIKKRLRREVDSVKIGEAPVKVPTMKTTSADLISVEGTAIKAKSSNMVPAKVIGVKTVPGVTNELIASMDLDEMLEASKIIDMEFRGEKIPTIKSPRVRKYVRTVLLLNKELITKSIAKKMQQDLIIKIVEKNKKTTNEAEAKRLYHELMEDE